jgi:hypothetical protein
MSRLSAEDAVGSVSNRTILLKSLEIVAVGLASDVVLKLLEDISKAF